MNIVRCVIGVFGFLAMGTTLCAQGDDMVAEYGVRRQVNLMDFCEDEALAQKAVLVLDLMIADMALNQFHGMFGSTHGRSYFRHKIDGERENTRGIHHLLFGLNAPKVGSMAAVALVLSQKYRMPQVLYDMAQDQAILENRQRMSI